MGILTDAFIASDAEVACGDFSRSVPAELQPVIEAKGIDTVPLGLLKAIVSEQGLGDTQVGLQAFVIGLEHDFPCVRDMGEHWVYRFPNSLVKRLGQLAPTEINAVAAQWARSEEMGGPNATREYVADLSEYLGRLSWLCDRAVQDGKNVYMWMSL